MHDDDIRIIKEILEKKERSDLAGLLSGANGEVDESSSYGSYLNSTIAQYLFFLPLEKYHKAKDISEKDKKVLFDSVLYLYPYQANSPEIRSIDFRLLRVEDENLVTTERKNRIDHEFVKEQWDKCNEKISREDYDGAISSAGSLLEGVFGDIYKKCTGVVIGKSDDLRKDYKKIKGLLKLSEEQYSNESVKSLMQGLSTVVGGIDAIRNQMGDRHVRLTKPWKRHAKLCVNSSLIIADYLYETLEFQQKKVGYLYTELIELLDGSRRLLGKESLLADKPIVEHKEKYDSFLKQLVKDRIINFFEIERFRSSDIFFAAMTVFFDDLTKEDMTKIYKKHMQNSQACGLEDFLRLVKKEKPEILSDEINSSLGVGKAEKIINTDDIF